MLARGAFLLGALLSALSSSDGLGVPSAPVLQRLGAMKEKRAAFVPGLRTSLPAVARSGASICDERAEVRRASPALRGTIASGMQFGKESGKSAVLDKPVVAPAPGDVQQKDPEKPYHVLLFNDPMNTREFVCEVLCSVFGHTKSQAYSIMQTAHTTGFAVCNTTDKEEADSQSAELGQNNLMSSVVQAD